MTGNLFFFDRPGVALIGGIALGIIVQRYSVEQFLLASVLVDGGVRVVLRLLHT